MDKVLFGENNGKESRGNAVSESKKNMKTEIGVRPDAERLKRENKQSNGINNRDLFFDNINKICNGNKYLEGMIVGDLLNSPRFKNKR